MTEMSFEELPDDVLVIVMRSLSAHDLASLARVSRTFHRVVSNPGILKSTLLSNVYDQVNTLGWAEFVRANPRPLQSLSSTFTTWDAYAQVRYVARTDKNWTNQHVTSHSLARPWHGKLQSLLAVNERRLVIAAGEILYCYTFSASLNAKQSSISGVHLEASYNLGDGNGPRRDVTGLAFIPGEDSLLCVGFQDGSLEEIELPCVSTVLQALRTLGPEHRWSYDFEAGSFIKAVSASRDSVLSISYSGRATLFSSASEDVEPYYFNLGKKCWTAHLNMHHSTPFAAFGSTSTTPLIIHPIRESTIETSPSHILGSTASEHSRPAAYAIAQPTVGAPWGSPDNIIISGWFDGVVRCYDLRSSTPGASSAEGDPVTRRPILSLHDPWAYEAFYSVAFGGGANAHVAGGCARHSLVAFWDVRSARGPRAGWSAYGLGGDGSSPVYALHLETSRLFGTTQSRAFAFDFGPDVAGDTYDPLPPPSAHRRRTPLATSVPVTKYMHTSGHDTIVI
jgi:hypothetical protein